VKHGWLLALALGLIVGAGGAYLLFVRPADSRARELRLNAERLAGELEAATADYQRINDELRARTGELEKTLSREREQGRRVAARATELAGILERLATSGGVASGIVEEIRGEVGAALESLARLSQQLESRR